MVLLVLFMPAQIDMPHGRDVDLAKVLHPVGMLGAEREDATVISIRRDGAVWIGSSETRPEALPAMIRASMAQGGERKVYIRADARAKYKVVREVEAAVRAAGIENVAFLVESRSSL